MMTLDELQTAVGEWSRSNFGAQQSKVNPGLFLDSLAPLLGIGEEIGELADAEYEMNLDGAGDAIGDIVIYLCDYCARENLFLGSLWMSGDWNFEGVKPMLSAAYGRLLHYTLKRHQGIRGMDDYEEFVRKQRRAVINIYGNLDLYARTRIGESAWSIGVATWQNIVSKRDWRKDDNKG